MTGHTPWAEIRHKRDDPVEVAMDALRRVDPATVVEPGDIRMAFEAVYDEGWALVKPEDCCAQHLADLDAEFWTP